MTKFYNLCHELCTWVYPHTRLDLIPASCHYRQQGPQAAELYLALSSWQPIQVSGDRLHHPDQVPVGIPFHHLGSYHHPQLHWEDREEGRPMGAWPAWPTSVTQLLKGLKWRPLADRRRYHRIIVLLFKLIHGLVNISPSVDYQIEFRDIFWHFFYNSANSLEMFLFICNVCTSLVKIIFAELKGYIDGDHVRVFFSCNAWHVQICWKRKL